jgi:hypothetical protein
MRSTMMPQPLGPEPLAVPIQTAVILSGLSRSELYRRLGAGDVRAVKAGKRTLILVDSLRALLASLPPATFHRPREAA